MIAEFIREVGGIRPPATMLFRQALSLAEREQISRGLAAGDSSTASLGVWVGRPRRSAEKSTATAGGRAIGRLAPRMSHVGEPEDLNHANLRNLRGCVRPSKTNWPRNARLSRSPAGWPEPIQMMRRLRVSHETIYRSGVRAPPAARCAGS
jgi:hypothetical protein